MHHSGFTVVLGALERPQGLGGVGAPPLPFLALAVLICGLSLSNRFDDVPARSAPEVSGADTMKGQLGLSGILAGAGAVVARTFRVGARIVTDAAVSPFACAASRRTAVRASSSTGRDAQVTGR